MAKKLKINIELPIRTEYEGLINIVASMNGWTPTVNVRGEDGEISTVQNPLTPIQFIESFISPTEKANLKSIITNSISSYYGRSQQALSDQVGIDYDNGVSCSVTFEDVIEPTPE